MSKAKEGTIFVNTKRNVCVVLKSDDRYDWVLSKTKQGFCCNHYGKWWIEDCLDRKVYEIIGQYPTWQEAVNSKEFKGE